MFIIINQLNNLKFKYLQIIKLQITTKACIIRWIIYCVISKKSYSVLHLKIHRFLNTI